MKKRAVFLSRLCLASPFVVGLFFLLPAKASAAIGDSLPSTPEAEKALTLEQIVSSFYTILSSVTITAAVIAGLVGAYMYMASSGDPKKVTAAKDIVVRAMLGMLVVALAYVFFRSIGITSFP